MRNLLVAAALMFSTILFAQEESKTLSTREPSAEVLAAIERLRAFPRPG